MKTLTEEYSQGGDIKKKLDSLPFKPQDELFKRVFGCGKQCPFCKVPCEAGGKDHSEHHASVHRPQGLGRYQYFFFFFRGKLAVNICTTGVQSDIKFSNINTGGKFHPLKEYRTYYPDWNIAPDSSVEASDYWKYVLTTFNERFAVEYHAQSADIPETWKTISKDQALKSINEVFNMK
ncbi:UNVERIFIED_CONTAM: hypothetical protein FKN15_061190 [Acipenser sinensis]